MPYNNQRIFFKLVKNIFDVKKQVETLLLTKDVKTITFKIKTLAQCGYR